MRLPRLPLLAGVLAAGCAGPPPARAPAARPPAPTYEVWVANESSDLVSHVAFTPGEGPRVVRDIPVGLLPGEIDGAHGIAVAPDGSRVYVTLAHGTPYGSVWQFDAAADTLVGKARLGLFPATMALTPDGALLLAVNFNLHGDPVPSDVSVVHTASMLEVTRIPTCLMPHGGRVAAGGGRHYSACMHSDQLVEIDLGSLRVARRFSLAPGREGALERSDLGEGHGDHGGAPVCSPTWTEPGEGPRADRFVYVACNRNGEVVEVDTGSWAVTRRFATGAGPYNLEATKDGRWLLATLKGAQAVALFDLEAGREVARVPTTRNVTHGVVASGDGRFAFVTNEAVGGVRGTLDVIDLASREVVATLELHHQPGGIDIRPSGPGR